MKTVVAFCRFSVSTFIYLIYFFLFVLLGVFDKIFDFLIIKHLYHSEATAQFGRILCKRKISELQGASVHDFICLFWSRVRPEYVLQPNISLYCVTENEAIFVETAEDSNIYSSDENPFLYVAQFIRSKNVIKMPIRYFHELAEKVGDPTVPLVWVSNTGRCGSTILCQVFESVPGTLVISEPDATLNVYHLHASNAVSDREQEQLLKSTIRVLSKPYPGTERVVIKTRSVCIGLMVDISTLFPDAKHLFMYRNCLDLVSSFSAASSSIPYTVVMRTCIDSDIMSAILPFVRRKLRFDLLCKLKNSPEVPLDTNIVGLFTHMWANYILVARDAMKRHPDIFPIKYEDLVANPLETCEVIFERTGLDPKQTNQSLYVFSKDSQRGSFFSRANLGNRQSHSLSDSNRITADAILSKYGLPRMGDDFRI